ncbi:hypothetical protein K439DRAFT_1629604 [Ramaria rubella]|nr:hypothetical protein K439DRAFT_1629604 [Ramaria rubella]
MLSQIYTLILSLALTGLVAATPTPTTTASQCTTTTTRPRPCPDLCFEPLGSDAPPECVPCPVETVTMTVPCN